MKELRVSRQVRAVNVSAMDLLVCYVLGVGEMKALIRPSTSLSKYQTTTGVGATDQKSFRSEMAEFWGQGIWQAVKKTDF